MTDHARTRDGKPLVLRTLQESDRDRLADHFRRLGPESRYRRFLAPKTSLTDSELEHFTAVDHHDAEALIALDDADEIVGVARYFVVSDQPHTAEVAIAIADEWQHRGVGTELLRRLMARGAEDGLTCFVATCLVTNEDMINLFEELGDGVGRTRAGAGTVELEITLPQRMQP